MWSISPKVQLGLGSVKVKISLGLVQLQQYGTTLTPNQT